MAKRKSAEGSMDPDFDALANKRATSLGFHFPTYVNQLIQKDLSGGEALVVQDEPVKYGGKKI